ncbi:hypothetical protein D3C86_1909160 [compost metagenome]
MRPIGKIYFIHLEILIMLMQVSQVEMNLRITVYQLGITMKTVWYAIPVLSDILYEVILDLPYHRSLNLISCFQQHVSIENGA